MSGTFFFDTFPMDVLVALGDCVLQTFGPRASMSPPGDGDGDGMMQERIVQLVGAWCGVDTGNASRLWETLLGSNETCTRFAAALAQCFGLWYGDRRDWLLLGLRALRFQVGMASSPVHLRSLYQQLITQCAKSVVMVAESMAHVLVSAEAEFRAMADVIRAAEEAKDTVRPKILSAHGSMTVTGSEVTMFCEVQVALTTARKLMRMQSPAMALDDVDRDTEIAWYIGRNLMSEIIRA